MNVKLKKLILKIKLPQFITITSIKIWIKVSLKSLSKHVYNKSI